MMRNKIAVSLILALITLFSGYKDIFASKTSMGFNETYYGLQENVNKTTGALIVAEADLNVPGKNGLNFTINRSYSSQQYQSAPSEKPNITSLSCRMLGFGWSFSWPEFAMCISDYVIVKQGTGYASFKLNTANNHYEPERVNNFSYATVANNQITLVTDNGITCEFTEHVITDEIKQRLKNGSEPTYFDHVVDKAEYYLLSKIKNSQGNNISFSYETYGSGYEESTTSIFNNEETLMNLIGDLVKSYFTVGPEYSESVYVTDVLSKLYISKKRINTITDTWGNLYTFNYGTSSNLCTTYQDFTVSEIEYTNTNGSTKKIVYHYNESGYLTSVVRRGQTISYSYEFYDCPIKKIWYKSDSGSLFGGWYVYKVHYAFENDPAESSTWASSDLTDLDGYVLNKITQPLGSQVEFDYGTVLVDESDGEDSRYIRNATGPIIAKKKVYKTAAAKEYEVTFTYEKDSNGYPLKTKQETAEGGTIYYFAKVSLDYTALPSGVVSFPAESFQYNEALPINIKKGDFETKNTWDYEKQVITKKEILYNSTARTTTVYTYGDYNNRTQEKLYQGTDTSGTLIKTVDLTYHNSGTAFDNNFVHLLKTQKITQGTSAFKERFFQYNANGQVTHKYRSVAENPVETDLLETLTYKTGDGRLEKITRNGITGYTEFTYNDADNFEGETARSVTKKVKTATKTIAEDSSYCDPATGLPLGTEDINDAKTVVSYDEHDRKTKVVAADGGTTEYDYSALYTANTISVTALGIKVDEVFDNFGRLISKTNKTSVDASSGSEIDAVSYDYYFGSLIKSETSASVELGTRTRQTSSYDGQLRKTGITTPYGTTSYIFDDTNMQVTVINKDKDGTEYVRTVKQLDELNRVTEERYNDLEAKNEPKYTSSFSEYSLFGEAQISNIRGVYHLFTIDEEGRTAKSYWSKNSELSLASPGTWFIDNQYHADSGLLDKYTVNGATDIVYDWVYDDFGRTKSLSVDSSEKASFTWDTGCANGNGEGQINAAANDDSETSYDFDSVGRVVKESVTLKGAIAAYTSSSKDLDYTYYADGSGLKQVVFADDKAIKYNLDNHKRVKSIAYGVKDTETVGVSYYYKANGSISYITFKNGWKLYYEYGAGAREGLVTGIVLKEKVDGTEVERYRQDYEYDSLGNINTTSFPNLFKSNSTITENYTYDIADELKTVSVTTGGNTTTRTYNYDQRGNFTQYPLPDGSSFSNTSFTLNSDGYQYDVQTWPDNRTIDFEYDALGNLTKKTYKNGSTVKKVMNYVYDYQSQLQQVKGGVAGTTELARYGYNTNGNMVWSVVGNQAKWYYWSGDNIVAEGTPDQEFCVRYIYSNNQKIAMLRPKADGTEEWYFFVNNAAGTPAAIFNEQGRIIHREQIDVYGNLEKGVAGSKNEINFTGKKLEYATGLYYFNQRWYDPEIGRFLTHDPAGQCFNPYVYCSNNPLSYVDPNGEEGFFTALLSALGPVGTIVGAAIDIGLAATAWDATSQVVSHIQDNYNSGEQLFNFSDFDYDEQSGLNAFTAGALGSITGGLVPDLGDSWWMNAVDDGISRGMGRMIQGSIGQDLSSVHYGDLFAGGFIEGSAQSLGNRVLDGISLTIGQEYNLSLADIQKQLANSGMAGAIVARSIGLVEHWGVEVAGSIQKGFHVLGKKNSPLDFGPASGGNWRIVRMLTSVNEQKSKSHAFASGIYFLPFNNCVHAAKEQLR